MGYRLYIGSLPRKEWDEIKDFTIDEVKRYKGEDPEDEDSYVAVYHIAYNELHEFGKYVDYKNDKIPVFSNEETQKYFDDEHDFYIVDKKFLEFVIDEYKNKNRSYFSDMKFNPESEFIKSKSKTVSDSIDNLYDYNYDFSKLTQDECNMLHEIISHINDKNHEWDNNWTSPYSLDDSSDCIVNSWKYEYAIFELVRIYKSFDWDNNVMVYYGF